MDKGILVSPWPMEAGNVLKPVTPWFAMKQTNHSQCVWSHMDPAEKYGMDKRNATCSTKGEWQIPFVWLYQLGC